MKKAHRQLLCNFVLEKEYRFLAPGSFRWDNAIAVGQDGVTYYAGQAWGEVTAIGATLEKKPTNLE